MPRTEMARRPPKAENRAHIPRAIASRDAMLWQGCSLSPRELERKAPRSVWATELPASRPICWIVRDSREAHSAGGSPSALRLRGATRKATRPCAAHGRTSAQLSATSTPIHPLYNRFPTPHQPFSNRRAEPIIRVPCATQKAFRRRLRPSSQHHAPHPERRRIGSEVVMLPSGSCQTSVPFST